MKKKLLIRAAYGLPVGIAIGYIITVFTSLCWGNGRYLPCAPDLAVMAGSEMRAVIVQTVFMAFIGVGYSAASVIWEIEHWSLAKQTGIYFLILSLIMMPVAYFSYWMEHSVTGFLIYFGIFILIFFMIWGSMFLTIKYRIHKINKTL